MGPLDRCLVLDLPATRVAEKACWGAIVLAYGAIDHGLKVLPGRNTPANLS